MSQPTPTLDLAFEVREARAAFAVIMSHTLPNETIHGLAEEHFKRLLPVMDALHGPLHAQSGAMKRAIKDLLMEIGMSAADGEIVQPNASALVAARAILKEIEP